MWLCPDTSMTSVEMGGFSGCQQRMGQCTKVKAEEHDDTKMLSATLHARKGYYATHQGYYATHQSLIDYLTAAS